MNRALVVLALGITVLVLVAECYVLNTLAFHIWAGSFAPTPERVSQHRSMVGLMAAIGLALPLALAWIWVVTCSQVTRTASDAETTDQS